VVTRAARRLRAADLTPALKTDLEAAAARFAAAVGRPAAPPAGWLAAAVLTCLEKYVPPAVLLAEGDTVERDALWAIATRVAESAGGTFGPGVEVMGWVCTVWAGCVRCVWRAQRLRAFARV
jgi:hypothetical protein